MKLTVDQKIQVAQIAKELTLQFAGKMKYTDTSTRESMNEGLTQSITTLYATIYNSIKNEISEE
jgi:hypothetical protein